MKISIDRKKITEALTTLAKAAARGNAMPILTCVLLRAEGDAVRLTASDLDIEVTLALPAAVAETGGCALPAAQLRAIVSRMTGERIDIADDGQRARVAGGRAKAHLPVLPLGDFPLIPAVNLPAGLDLPASRLAAMLEACSIATSTDGTRWYLAGVFLHHDAEDGCLHGAATDGHRLVWVRTGEATATAWSGIIVPASAVSVMVPACRAHDADQAEVRASDSKIRLSLPGLTITSKLVDGTFPDYRRVVPPAFTRSARIGRAALLDAVGRVNALANEDTNSKGRAIHMTHHATSLALRRTAAEASSSITDEVDAVVSDQAVDADPFVVGVNGVYLAAALGSLDCETVDLATNDAMAPLRLTPVGEHGLAPIHIIMPMRG
ncbi:MAG: DNA polymerase III subunit beta [Hyphomicrobiaceae bacterium]|nr:DNA polymerase III subunit beta [Hyphomicrobiaceae bacterium]